MSLESILESIQNKAQAEAQDIIKSAKKEAQDFIQETKKETLDIYQGILNKEKAFYERQKQKLLVNARLESKKTLLSAKQGLIDSVFQKLKEALEKTKLKKKQIAQDKVHEVSEDVDFYLKQIRPDFEGEIASILFL